LSIRPLVVVFLLLTGLLACAAIAAETGIVEEVVDGDTLRVRTAGSAESVTVRLIGIDAPERSHPSLGKEFFSDESASHLASLCRGKTVRMEKDAEETDRHDRLLRYVFLPPPDGRLLNEEMLRSGMARSYTRFPFSRKDGFLAAEGRARREGKGLWKDGGMAEARWLAAGNGAPERHRAELPVRTERDEDGGRRDGARPSGKTAGGRGRAPQPLEARVDRARGERGLAGLDLREH